MKRSRLLLAALTLPFAYACASRPEGGVVRPPQNETQVTPAPIAASAEPPQSFTPEAKPKPRTTAITQRWMSRIGRTDHRTTMAYSGKDILVGARGGSGVHVLDGKTGAAKATLPGAKGDIVGIALEGERVYSSSSAGATGEIAAATRDGKLAFRADVGAPVTTPPTLVAVEGTLALAVGDAKGNVSLFDAGTGKRRWRVALTPDRDAHPSIGAGLAAADLDGDGQPEIIAGTESGRLVALRGKSGEVAWSVQKPSSLRAAPLLADIDADKKLEVIAGWADGDVAIFEGSDGRETWSAHVERDDGDPTGLLASPTPLPSPRVGSLLVPTARWGKEDAVVVLRKHFRAYQSQQGRVVSSPVMGVLEPGSTVVEAVVGTARGDVIAFDATGGVGFLYHVDGAIEASPLIADVDGEGAKELIVATTDGKLYCLALHATAPPVLSRGRGDSLRNTGVLGALDLGWQLR
jgi:outer membrane protein assembly factor BamB